MQESSLAILIPYIIFPHQKNSINNRIVILGILKAIFLGQFLIYIKRINLWDKKAKWSGLFFMSLRLLVDLNIEIFRFI
jgi:hypothetical protein